MNNARLAFIVITHERHQNLKTCLASLIAVAALEQSASIDILCADNSCHCAAENNDLFQSLRIAYIQRPNASQTQNFISALELASRYDFFALVHDDDLVCPFPLANLQLTSLGSGCLHYLKSYTLSAETFKLVPHFVDLHHVNAQSYLSAAFPHRLPLFPSYIYPKEIIPFFRSLLLDPSYEAAFGKYRDTAIVLTLLKSLKLKLCEIECPSYIYFLHPSQDSSVPSILHKLRLFFFVRSLSQTSLRMSLVAFVCLLRELAISSALHLIRMAS